MPILHPQDKRRATDFRRNIAVAILNGAAVQDGFLDLHRACETVVGVVMPAAWTAASITLLTVPPLTANPPTATWVNVYERDGTEYEITVGVNQYVIIPPGDLAGIRYLKLRSGTSGTPVAQAAKRTITLITRPV